jgi:hypothetical protein
MAQSQQKVVVYVHVYGWYKQVSSHLRPSTFQLHQKDF